MERSPTITGSWVQSPVVVQQCRLINTAVCVGTVGTDEISSKAIPKQARKHTVE